MTPERNKPPAELAPAAAKWWPVMIDELAARGTLRRVARHRLMIYCQLFTQYLDVTEIINRDGQVQTHAYPAKEGEEQQRKREEISAEALQQEKLVKQIRAFD